MCGVLISTQPFDFLADIDECGSDDKPCFHGAMCVNLPGSYACQCKPGYHIIDIKCQGK